MISAPEDIFYLTVEETLSLESGASCLSKIPARKLEYERNMKLVLPDVIRDEDNPGICAEQPPLSTGLTLKGIAVSMGKARGTARVINSPDEIRRLKHGDIMVTDHTDPCWTPAFVTISGLVTNTGGLMSHSSITAREYGLPAVVNIANATKIIKDGLTLYLDGDSGTVTMLDSTDSVV